FQAEIKTEQGVDLTSEKFDQHRALISSASDYQTSQLLGSNMREAGIEAFLYYSARDPQQGKNIGLFTPNAFAEKSPLTKSWQTWQCNATDNTVEFIRQSVSKRKIITYNIKDFLVNGSLPQPAH
ncbi:unnamed protein product, partial [marine sediment metagenome]